MHTDNAGDGGGTADLLSGNDVSACTAGGYGVWTFVAYIAPTVSNNTISGCDGRAGRLRQLLPRRREQLPRRHRAHGHLHRQHGHRHRRRPRAARHHTSFDFGDGPVKVQADHNVISGADDGVYVEEPGGKVATVAAVRSSLAGNTVARPQHGRRPT